MNTSWFYGFAPFPKMSFLNVSPNNSATVKLLALGRVRVVLLQLTTLLEVASTTCGPAFESLESIDGIRDWTSEKMQEYVMKGVKVYHGLQQAGDMLVIPQALVLAEVGVEGQELTYGFRKSFMIGGEMPSKEYEAAVPLYQSSGRDTTRLSTILDLIKG